MTATIDMINHPVDAERFWSNVERRGPEECWPWTASRQMKRGGYGQIRGKNRRTLRAHIVAYELTKGPVPDGFFVCHRCNNAPCCNPTHLYAGTPRQNWHDVIAAGNAYQLPTLRGEESPSAKLTAADVAFVRASDESHAALGRRFGVTKQAIFRIRKRKSWKHV